jgi:signal peptidase I
MANAEKKPTNLLDTIQSLVVAFVLAMVFRGFVVEGFVIPTGSMAPTLLGQHLLKHSDQTGNDFTVGFDARQSISPDRFSDPLLGRNVPLSMAEAKQIIPRGGDRVLVLKTLYPFMGPNRFDVVVFKNPTDTQGESANYIKRLIGLPGETIWIADGDVFARQNDLVDGTFEIQRKPEYIQRSLWRPVSDTDAIPTNVMALNRPWQGTPWIAKPNDAWTIEGRTWYCNTALPTDLDWDSNKLKIDDWLPYNMLMPKTKIEPISDIRVSATFTPETDELIASFTLEILQHRLNWMVTQSMASLAMVNFAGDVVSLVETELDAIQAGVPVRVECWHADQMMAMYINGTRIVELPYSFTPEERLRFATNSAPSVPIEDIAGRSGADPSLKWQFDGSPFVMTRLQVDHDLFYRSARLPSRATKNPTTPGNEELVRIGSPAFGTHPDTLAVLRDDQFMMAGDNSTYSLDSRLWGNPDEFVAAQIDDSPFVVHRDLLIGKAWGVYWLPPPLVPDFNRFRFIR